MTETTETPVLFEQRGPIAIVTFNRPHRRNAITAAMIEEAVEIYDRIAADDAIEVVILTGTGDSFCAGLDLEAFGAGKVEADDRFIERVRDLPQATIAAVNGPAVTGGIEVALACDMRFGSANAKFADTHVRVGVLQYGGATVMLPSLVGVARAKEMQFTGRYVLAEEAERWGLLNSVVEGDVLEHAIRVGEQIATNAPYVRRLKSLIDDGQDRGGFRDALDHEKVLGMAAMRVFDPSSVTAKVQGIKERGRGEVAAG
jgi:enoyl-CoA hydratase